MNKVDIESGDEQKKHGRNYFGYAVCFGTAITFISGIGHVNSFGIIYNDFIIDTNASAKSLTTAHGVFAIMIAIGGIILNVISKNISLRAGGIIGAILFIIGSFTTVVISSTNQLPITFGVLQGIGFGIMVPVSYSTINQYFDKKRTTVMSLIKTVQGLVLMWYPQLIKIVLSQYGFRGTLLIISGISLHTLPGMLVMRNTVKRTTTNVKHGNSKVFFDNVEIVKKDEDIDLLPKKANEAIVDETNVEKQNTFRKKLSDIFHLKSFEDPVYRNICIYQSFVNFSDLTFFILLPMLLFQYGFDTSEVVTCLSITAAADVAGRGGLAIISNFTQINTRLLFNSATLLTFVFRIVILQLSNFIWVAITTGILGVLKAWLHVASPLVISNHVSHKDFPGAYALFMLIGGVINVTCSPLIGLLKDVYQDYVPAFYALTLCCVPCLVVWPIEYICIRNKT